MQLPCRLPLTNLKYQTNQPDFAVHPPPITDVPLTAYKLRMPDKPARFRSASTTDYRLPTYRLPLTNLKCQTNQPDFAVHPPPITDVPLTAYKKAKAKAEAKEAYSKI